MKIETIQYTVIQRDDFFYPRFTHKDWTVYIPIRGSFRCTLNGKTETVSPGEVFVIPPETPFQRTVLQPLLVHFIRFTLSEPAPLPWGTLTYKDPLRAEQTVTMLKNSPKIPEKHREALLRHCLSDLFVQYQYERDTAPQDGEPKDETVERILSYWKENYAAALPLSRLAERFGISPSGLIKKFQRTVGIPPSRYLTELRIKHAKRFLVDTSVTISEIADRTGFESVYYFSKVFKKETGVSPSEYRKNYLI